MIYNLFELYTMQKQLDQTIHHQHQKTYANTINERVLALLVELGELANETRCFKYWSQKKSSPKDVILEEYSDGMHFILSLGIHMNIDLNTSFTPLNDDSSLTMAFLHLYQIISEFSTYNTLDRYIQIMNQYLGLGLLLNIQIGELKSAYIEKNKINFERQKNNY